MIVVMMTDDCDCDHDSDSRCSMILVILIRNGQILTSSAADLIPLPAEFVALDKTAVIANRLIATSETLFINICSWMIF